MKNYNNQEIKALQVCIYVTVNKIWQQDITRNFANSFSVPFKSTSFSAPISHKQAHIRENTEM